MARYIDADAYLENERPRGISDEVWEQSHLYKSITNAPTADVVERKKGKWIPNRIGKWVYADCSECGTVHDTRTNYCPNCGASMSTDDPSHPFADDVMMGTATQDDDLPVNDDPFDEWGGA